MSDAEESGHGLCARNQCNFVILILGLALVAAPAPMGYSGNSIAVTASIASGMAIWICSLAAMIGLKRPLMAACALCGVGAAAAPWMLGFAHVQGAALAHGAVGSAVAAVALGGLAMSTARASLPVRA